MSEENDWRREYETAIRMRNEWAERAERIAAALFPPPKKMDSGAILTADADDELESVIYDLEEQGADAVCVATLRRVRDQIIAVRRVLAEAQKD